MVWLSFQSETRSKKVRYLFITEKFIKEYWKVIRNYLNCRYWASKCFVTLDTSNLISKNTFFHYFMNVSVINTEIFNYEFQFKEFWLSCGRVELCRDELWRVELWRVRCCAVSSYGRSELCGVELWPYRDVPRWVVCVEFSLCRVVSCRNDGLPLQLFTVKGGVRVFKRKKPHLYEFFSEIRMKWIY